MNHMQSSDTSLIEHQTETTFSEVFWRKLREEMRIEIIIEKKPKKQLKLYEIDEEDLNINLQSVQNWSEDNQKLYYQLKENGFADFICNKENLIENYTQLVFDKEKVTTLDPTLQRFINLTLLRLNSNRISQLENIPQNLKELHLYSNPIQVISNKVKQDQLIFLGLGYCQLNDLSIDNLAKKLPNLINLDLTHNNLCDLESAIDNMKRLTNLKVLSLFGNPLALLPQYQANIVSSLINLQYFDEQKAQDIRQRLYAEEQAKQQAIQAEIKRQQDEQIAREAELLKQQQGGDKNKKAAKQGKKEEAPPPPVQQIIMPSRLQTQPSKYFEGEGNLNIQLKDATNFKISIHIRTLENLDGILLDRWVYPEMEQKPEFYQSKYWLAYSIQDQTITTQENKILYETGVQENDKGRIDFNHLYDICLKPTISIRDFIEKGLLITILCEQPIMFYNDEGELKPELTVDNIPKQEVKVVGLCKVELDWLRGQNKDISKKYYLFKENVKDLPEFWFPYEQENKMIESRMVFIQAEIQKEQQILKEQMAVIEAKKEQQLKGGKGKEIKKKDDKKQVKKGKDAEPEKKVIPILDFQTYERQYIYVNDKIIMRTQPYLLSVFNSLGY